MSNNTIRLNAVLKNISDYLQDDKIFSYEEVKDFVSKTVSKMEVKSSV